MTNHIDNTRATLAGALVLAGVSLAGLSGCQLEEAGRNTGGKDAVTGKAESALQVTSYDFIAHAAGASWTNNDSGLPWETNDTRGACFKATGVMENGASSPYLFTQPKPAESGYMRAAYTVTIPAASLHPTVTATFGFTQGTHTGDGVTFKVTTQVNGAWVTIFSQTKNWTGALTTVTADLSAYGGQTMQLLVTADAGATTTDDRAAWTDLRILADSPATPTNCTIGGVSYATGDVNPAVSCQVCDPSSNPTAWSIRADSCLIGGQCYTADALDTLKCKRCDPLVSQTSWTAKTSCDNLIVASTGQYWITAGNFGGISVADNVCNNGAAATNQGLPGTWRAMLSQTGVRDYRDAVPSTSWSLPVVNLHGEQLYPSWSAIFSNPIWPAGVSMWGFMGEATSTGVWTGTGNDGKWATASFGASNCGTWNSLWFGFFYTTAARYADLATRNIVNSTEAGCMSPLNVMCVLVPPGGVGGAPPPPSPLQVTVENYDGTALGTIQGKAHRDAYAYLGIPYAAAPTGNLRLAPPAKATSWSGVRNAFNQPPACAQPPLLPTGGMIGSEDCLYLNVWAPKSATPSSNLPVLVFQHGGGNIFGGTASSDDWLAAGFIDGDRFAASQNAIVVTIQSRLGALGWMADPALAADSTTRTSTVSGGTSGNYGLLDLLQALKWVKKNVAKFGGDPTHVTLSGESSGASMVCHLLASPLAKDPADNTPYFASVVMESGFCEAPSTNYRVTQTTSYMPTLGCASAPNKVACLRSAPLQNFVNAAGPVLGFFPTIFNQALPPELGFGLTFGANVDGYVLPAQPRTIFAAGTHNKVPAIVGTNKDEANFFFLFMVGGILTGDLTNMVVLTSCLNRDARANVNLGATLGAAAAALYSCTSHWLSPTLSYSSAITHAQYECPARRTLRALSQGQTQPVRRYWFAHAADHVGVFHNVLGLIPQVGAAHTFEMPFIFNTHGTMLWYWPSTRERALTTAVQSYWRAFAASGDPNYTGGVNWAAYNVAQDNALKLEVTGKSGVSDPGLQMISGIDTAQCDFWDDNYTIDGWK